MTEIEATFVQGDTDPDIVAQLHDEKVPTILLDLSGDTHVRFQMRKPDDRLFTVDAPCDITNAPEGMVSYTWAPKDLGVPGEYDAQWQVTFPDGKIQTTAHPNRILVRRK